MDYLIDISGRLNFLAGTQPSGTVFKLVSKLLKDYRDLEFFAERLGSSSRVGQDCRSFLHYEGCELTTDEERVSDKPDCSCMLARQKYYELLDSIGAIENFAYANSQAYWIRRL